MKQRREAGTENNRLLQRFLRNTQTQKVENNGICKTFCVTRKRNNRNVVGVVIAFRKYIILKTKTEKSIITH